MTTKFKINDSYDINMNTNNFSSDKNIIIDAINFAHGHKVLQTGFGVESLWIFGNSTTEKMGSIGVCSRRGCVL